MLEVLSHLGTALVGGGIATIVVGALNARNARHQTDRSVDAQLEEHRDGLALDLLKAAREERAAMQVELDRWKSLAAHLDDFDLALAHIEALLSAESGRQRAAIVRSAQIFLDRINHQRAVVGNFRQEAQVSLSGARTDRKRA